MGTGDPCHAAQVRARTLRARAELTRLFEHAGYPVIPSQANFILVQAPDEHADHASCVGVSQPTNVRANARRQTILPSNEHAIQRDPNEVIIGM